jgi:hypothetical protein
VTGLGVESQSDQVTLTTSKLPRYHYYNRGNRLNGPFRWRWISVCEAVYWYNLNCGWDEGKVCYPSLLIQKILKFNTFGDDYIYTWVTAMTWWSVNINKCIILRATEPAQWLPQQSDSKSTQWDQVTNHFWTVPYISTDIKDHKWWHDLFLRPAGVHSLGLTCGWLSRFHETSTFKHGRHTKCYLCGEFT